MKTLKITLLFSLLLLTYSSFSADVYMVTPADMCNVILKDGVFDIITKDETHTTSETNENFYCSKEFDEYITNRASNTSFGFSIKGVPLSFGHNQNNAENQRHLRELCSGSYSQVSTNDFLNFVSKTANKNILDAWNKCIETMSSPNVILFTPTVNGSIITVRAKFNGITGLSQPIVDELVSIGSVECKPSRMVRGTKISMEGITDFCMRKNQDEGVIILRTNMGDFTIQIARDRTGEVVGSFQVKTTVPVVTQKSLGRISQTFRTTSGGSCNNHGCAPRDYENILTVDNPFFLKNPKVDSTKFFINDFRPCDLSTPKFKSGAFKISLAIKQPSTQKIRVYGTNSAFPRFFEIVYSAEKWRTDTSSKTNSYSQSEIKENVAFTLTVPKNEKSGAKVVFVLNNKQFEVDPKKFEVGQGLKKVKEVVSPKPDVADTYTYIYTR